MGALGRRYALPVLLGAAALFGLGVVVGLAADGELTETVTSTQIKFNTVTETVATTVTVKAAPPAAPNESRIAVDYGPYEGRLRLSGLRLITDGSGYDVVGTFLDIDCGADYVDFDARAYRGNRVIETGYWNLTPVEQGDPYDFAIDVGDTRPDRVALEVGQLIECS